MLTAKISMAPAKGARSCRGRDAVSWRRALVFLGVVLGSCVGDIGGDLEEEITAIEQAHTAAERSNTVLFVIGKGRSKATREGDGILIDRIENLGFAVVLKVDKKASAEDAKGRALVVLSDSRFALFRPLSGGGSEARFGRASDGAVQRG
jgi:hypothetical protein